MEENQTKISQISSEAMKPEPDIMLIVDDDGLNRWMLENIFKPFYKIETAENGKMGMKKLLENQERIVALLLDVVMPEMDGMQLLHILEQNNILARIPVFLITSYDRNKVMEDAYTMGVMDVIKKPVVPYIVQRRVNSVVELFRTRRRLDHVIKMQEQEIAKQSNKILELNKGMIEALATAIEFRSGEAGAHVRRIYGITECILRDTSFGKGLSEHEIEQISIASIMHDVGKIAIPDAILNKPGKLTKEEFEIMKTHSLQGAMLLEKIPQMRNLEVFDYAYDIARHHHERWDGNGYPDGLKGNEISTWSQAVSLADVYDALVSKRVYKKSFTFEHAIEMILNGECGVFNPKLLYCFLQIEKQIRETLYCDAETAV